MSELHRYEPYKLPSGRQPLDDDSGSASSDYNPSGRRNSSISFDQFFAEIDIDDGKNSSYKSTPIPQPDYPVLDERRQLFKAMREIAWNNHATNIYNMKFYNKQTQHENSRVFYKQAVFMMDYEDEYEEMHPFSAYYPYYQLMTYEQLRTYFTWRTKLRKGVIEETSISYAFVYVYELLNNIGVTDPIDGLNKLLSFRKAILSYDSPIDKYLIRWIKDYLIYYQLTDFLTDFIYEHNLDGYYPEIVNNNNDWYSDFDALCELSKYNIKKSAFYNTESTLIAECFDFVIRRINSVFADNDIVLYNLLFQLSSKKTVWTPFKGALFYQNKKLPYKKIVLSDNEVYICSQNIWYQTVIVPTDRAKQLLAYIFKQLEAVLRKLTGYKYKLSADTNSVDEELLHILKSKGISLEKLVTDAVAEFHREKNKTVVAVDLSNVSRIRLEAQFTQEKLIVPESEAPVLQAPVSNVSVTATAADTSALTDKHTGTKQLSLSDFLSFDDPATPIPETAVISSKTTSSQKPATVQSKGQTLPDSDLTPSVTVTVPEPAAASSATAKAASSSTAFAPASAASGSTDFIQSQSVTQDIAAAPGKVSTSAFAIAFGSSFADGWTSLRQALSDVELEALSSALNGSKNIKQLADKHGIMLELLADSINEKAFDHIGDSILELDDTFIIYDEYLENVKAMVIDI